MGGVVGLSRKCPQGKRGRRTVRQYHVPGKRRRQGIKKPRAIHRIGPGLKIGKQGSGAAVACIFGAALFHFGIKGAGEGGINGVGVDIASAIDDALQMPVAVTGLSVTPQRLKDILSRAKRT